MNSAGGYTWCVEEVIDGDGGGLCVEKSLDSSNGFTKRDAILIQIGGSCHLVILRYVHISTLVFLLLL